MGGFPLSLGRGVEKKKKKKGILQLAHTPETTTDTHSNDQTTPRFQQQSDSWHLGATH